LLLLTSKKLMMLLDLGKILKQLLQPIKAILTIY